MKGKLYGLGGRYGSGKDVVANFLKFQFGFKTVGFSDAINEMMTTLDPYVMMDSTHKELIRYSTVVKAKGYVKAKEEPEVRRLLQVFGTEVGRRQIHEELWVDLMAEKVTKLTERGFNVAITGVRYSNELDMVHRLGGTSIWTSRPGFEETGTHASEVSLSEDMFEHSLINDGDISHLEHKVGLFMLEESGA